MHFYNSFFLNTIRSWNKLPPDVQNNPSLPSFKLFLKSKFPKLPNYFYVGNRIGQILHSKLRLECSSLNQHLYRRKMCNSPLCACGATESPEHYLIFCLQHAPTRSHTICTIKYPITVELLLYGSSDLSNNENKNIFLLVQRFIIESKRFSNTT